MTILETITRAIDWLEANPDKHIKGALAINTMGKEVAPTSPEADCFCVLGRIAREASLEGDKVSYAAIEEYLKPVGANADDFYDINDKGLSESGHDNIPALREFVATLNEGE